MKITANIGGLDYLNFDGGGMSFAIFFQGCRFHCKGCHNPEFQPFGCGTNYPTEEIINKITKHLDWYKSVVFMGGEPLEQKEALNDLLEEVQILGLETWLYTGYECEHIPSNIAEKCSVIVAGQFVESLATGSFPASSNQRVIDRRAL